MFRSNLDGDRGSAVGSSSTQSAIVLVLDHTFDSDASPVRVDTMEVFDTSQKYL
jgi:hypothetical protein